MNNVSIDRQKIDILANAISNKSGVPVTMTLDEMVEAVDGIKTGGGEPNLQTKTYTVDSAGTTTVIADSGYDGLSSVAVSVPSGSATGPTEAYTTSSYSTSSSNGYLVIYKDGVPTTPSVSTGYISSATSSARRVLFNTNIAYNPTVTVSEDTVTIPKGYYSPQITKSVASGTEGTPIATKGIVSNHQISVTPSVINTTGYITGSTKTGTAVTVSASELVSGTYNITSSGTKDVTNYASASVPAGSVTAPSSISGTAASVSTGTNTLTLTKTVSVTPNVTTAGYISSGTAGNSSVSLTANITTKAAATITPTTTNQTIAAGTYLTGTQTIAGDADLVGSNILSTANIFGVQGTVVVYNYYTGSSTPSSSLGENGDLYFQTED